MEQKLKECSGCGKMRKRWKSIPKLCKECWDKVKPRTPISKMTPKKKEKMKESGNYYRKAIGDNIIKNKGYCKCDNCPTEIKNALATKGHFVSHIISSGANEALYHHPLNHFILCDGCEALFSNTGKRHTMNIYPEFLKRHEQLNREYYLTS